MYTLADLEAARAEVQGLTDAFANDTSNNPNKFRAATNAARSKVRLIEEYLKSSGALPMTDHEKLKRRLDAAHPNAKSKEIVEFEGKKYQRRFTPLEMSRSGKTVMEWDKEWVELTNQTS